jgi:transposase
MSELITHVLVGGGGNFEAHPFDRSPSRRIFMMGRPPKFDLDFRKHAVELARVSSRPRSKIAFDLGVSDTTLSKWMNNSKKEPKEREDLSRSEHEELVLLRAEKREWILEREILKKATAFWVKESHK